MIFKCLGAKEEPVPPDLTPDPIAFADTTPVIIKTYGAPPFTNAITTAHSGTGAVTYSSDTAAVATVDGGGTVTMHGTGTAVISAEKAADDVYARASASYTLTVAMRQDGTAEYPFLIYDVPTLQKIGRGTDGWTLDKHYRMEADIGMAGAAWTPIGSYTSTSVNDPFTGTFDGNGHIISSLTINTADANNGLFASLGGRVQNLGMVHVNINSTDNYAGGLAGRTVAGSIMENCFVSGTVTGSNYAGGLVGSLYGTIRNCYSAVTVTATSFTGGGIAGTKNAVGIIENCYVTGSISVGNDAGGITTNTNSNPGIIANCVTLSPSITSIGTGGLAHRIGRVFHTSGGTLDNSYGRDTMILTTKNGAYIPVPGASGNDGADVTRAQWETQAWWSGTANYDFGANGAWEWNGATNLPILKGFAPGTQTHTVQ